MGEDNECDDGHAQRSAVGDAAPLEVRVAQPSANCIVAHETFVEAPVTNIDLAGEAAQLKEIVDNVALDLVKALPDVRTATCEMLASDPGKLEVKRQEEPSILSARRGSGTSKELGVLPRADPWVEMPEPDDTIEPVDLRQDGQ